MCSACGILQHGFDWTEGGVDPAAPRHQRLAERRRRIDLVNLLLEGTGVRLDEQGRQLVVCGATGRTRLVADLAHVWTAADALGRRRADPLAFAAPRKRESGA
jgi:hypothetical protein